MKTVPVIDPADPRLATLTLDSGAHDSPDKGMCFMEAVAWLRHSDQEPMDFNDAPRCVAKTIRAAGIALNDNITDPITRTALLKPLIPVVVGTATTAKDETVRAWMATDFLVRECLPSWMELTPSLVATAAKLRASKPLTNAQIARGIAGLLEEARTESAAAWAAARTAARTAAWDAARDAARTAAWDAARDAARTAAWDAARTAAWDAARDAARTAAWDAARTAAWDAARDAARAAKSSSYQVMYDAAKAKIAPTADALNAKCADLIRRMAEVGR